MDCCLPCHPARSNLPHHLERALDRIWQLMRNTGDDPVIIGAADEDGCMSHNIEDALCNTQIISFTQPHSLEGCDQPTTTININTNFFPVRSTIGSFRLSFTANDTPCANTFAYRIYRVLPCFSSSDHARICTNIFIVDSNRGNTQERKNGKISKRRNERSIVTAFLESGYGRNGVYDFCSDAHAMAISHSYIHLGVGREKVCTTTICTRG